MVGFVNDHTLFIQCKANIRAWFWMRKWIISCRLWYPAKASRVIGRSFFGSLFGPGTLITTFRHLSLGTLPLFCIAWTAASSFGMSPFSMAYHNGEVNIYAAVVTKMWGTASSHVGAVVTEVHGQNNPAIIYTYHSALPPPKLILWYISS